MKKLLLIVMVAAHFVAFGQKKKKSIPPPPEKITKQKVQKSPYRRIFEDNMMLAFQWRMEVVIHPQVVVAYKEEDRQSTIAKLSELAQYTYKTAGYHRLVLEPKVKEVS